MRRGKMRGGNIEERENACVLFFYYYFMSIIKKFTVLGLFFNQRNMQGPHRPVAASPQSKEENVTAQTSGPMIRPRVPFVMFWRAMAFFAGTFRKALKQRWCSKYLV